METKETTLNIMQNFQLRVLPLISTPIMTVIVVLVFLRPLQSHAERTVGNGAGVSEQNLTYVFNNLHSVLTACELFCGVANDKKENDEKSLLLEFEKQISQFDQILEFKSGLCTINERSGKRWKICTPTLGQYDIDGDQFLDLRESALLLFKMFANDDQQSALQTTLTTERLNQCLLMKSFSFPFSLIDGFAFHIFGYMNSKTTKPTLFLQSASTSAVELTADLFSENDCKDVFLMRPYLGDNLSQIDHHEVVVVFPMVNNCKNSPNFGKIEKKVRNFIFNNN